MLENMTRNIFSGEGELFPQLVDYPWFHGTLSRSDAAAMVLNRWGGGGVKMSSFLRRKKCAFNDIQFLYCTP